MDFQDLGIRYIQTIGNMWMGGSVYTKKREKEKENYLKMNYKCHKAIVFLFKVQTSSFKKQQIKKSFALF